MRLQEELVQKRFQPIQAPRSLSERDPQGFQLLVNLENSFVPADVLTRIFRPFDVAAVVNDQLVQRKLRAQESGTYSSGRVL